MIGVRSPKDEWRRLPLGWAVLLLCGVGVAGAAALDGFPLQFVAGFCVLALLRLTVARDGRRLLPRRIFRPFAVGATAFCMAWLFHSIVTKGPHDALIALMSVMCVLEGLVLVSKRDVFGVFLLILFSSVHAAGTAFSFPDGTGLLFTLAYVSVLLWTLILFERRSAYDREVSASNAVVLLRPDAGRALPLGAAMRTLVALVFIGFPLGALLYLVVPPREAFEFAAVVPDAGGSSEYADEDVEGKKEMEGGTLETPTAAYTGPGKGVPLGSVSIIKKDITPWFQVELADQKTYPPVVILRDNTKDYCTNDGTWKDSLSSSVVPRTYKDEDDGSRDGWVPLGHADRASEGVTLKITNLRGGHQRLYLQSNEVRIKFMRGARSRTGYVVRETADETIGIDFPIAAGDVILQRAVPQVPAGMRLEGRRSDRSLRVLSSHLQVPEASEASLRDIARKVVGGESDPWRRALALERWLNSDAFTYTLRAPKLNRVDPIGDFLNRTRSGSCSYYATALTLLLRTLGHPTRYVRGFWGGDRLEEMPAVVLRGSHYHAWTEMYLEGVGWVPLNPTPPDRAAADGSSFTTAEGAPDQEEEGFSFLFYDQRQWSRLWSSTGSWLATWIFRPLARLFSGQAGFAGYPLLLIFLVLYQRRRETKRALALAGGSRRSLPKGPYGQALLLLARAGVRRKTTWTAREFRKYVIGRYPESSRSTAALVRLYEKDRFGGGGSTREQALGQRALEELRSILAKTDPEPVVKSAPQPLRP